MACILHIAYRLEIKKWQVRTSEDKLAIANRKKQIIEKFREETGLLLDTPTQGGGNTNDGNSARRFFEHTKTTSRITGINEDIIKRFSVILRTISCDYPINEVALEKYCTETAELCITL